LTRTIRALVCGVNGRAALAGVVLIALAGGTSAI
jgi:hypothetical protein